jgi:integrase/recombinase XerD
MTESLEGFKEYLQTRQYSRKTIEGYARAVLILSEWARQENMTVEQLGYTDLLAYVKYRQNKGAKQVTVNRYLLAIRKYFNYLIEKEIVQDNPARYLKLLGEQRRKLHDTFTPLELESIYHKFCNKDFSSKRYHNLKAKHGWEHLQNKVMVGLLVYQGVRSHELIRLRPEDIKLRQGQVEIPGGANGERRELKLEACQIMDMHQHLTKQKEAGNEKLFTGSKGEKLYNALHKLAQQLNSIEPRIKDLKQIRASVIVKWLKLYNLRQVQYLAGHKWISSTEEYLHSETEGLQEEINKYHPLG